MHDSLDLFHFKQRGKRDAKKALFLFHGTGGNESDLFPLIQPFLETHQVVGLRGNVSEHGMLRFFERNEHGVFNQESIAKESEKLREFIRAWSKKHTVAIDNIFYLGYSNGGNMILATLLKFPELITNAAVLHAMLPYTPDNSLDLSRKKIFVSWGDEDPMIPPVQTQQMISVLRALGASLKVVQTDAGHQITRHELEELHAFISALE